MLPEKWGILFLSANAVTGKESFHDALPHAVSLLKNHFQADQPACFLLFLELDWLWDSADTLSDCHLSCGTNWFYFFESAAPSGDSLVYCAAALCRGRIFSAAAVTMPLYLSLCRCRQSDHRACTEAFCLLSAFPLSAWSAVAGSVAAAVLSLECSLVFAAGNRCTGWNLVADGSLAVYYIGCLICSRIFLALTNADRSTGFTDTRAEYTLQDNFTPCFFADRWQKKAVVQVAAAKPAALAAAALLGKAGDDADNLYWCTLQGATVRKWKRRNIQWHRF